MKKLLIILSLFAAACSLPKKEERFVNPIFYKPLESFNRCSDLYKITPSRLFTQNCYGYNTTVNCEMLENTMNTVVLKCLHTPEPEGSLIIAGDTPQVWTYKFYLWPDDEQDSTLGKYIRVYKHPRNEKEWSSYSNLFAYNKKESYMDIWKEAVNTFDDKTGVDNFPKD